MKRKHKSIVWSVLIIAFIGIYAITIDGTWVTLAMTATILNRLEILEEKLK